MNKFAYVLSDIGYLPSIDDYSEIVGVYDSMEKAEKAMKKYTEEFEKDAFDGIYGNLDLEIDNEIHGETYSEIYYKDEDYYALIKIEEFVVNAEV